MQDSTSKWMHYQIPKYNFETIHFFHSYATIEFKAVVFLICDNQFFQDIPLPHFCLNHAEF